MANIEKERASIPSEKFMTTAEVAELFRVSQRTVVRWMDAGHFHRVKFGRWNLIPRVEVEAALNENATPPFTYRLDPDGTIHMVEQPSGTEVKGF